VKVSIFEQIKIVAKSKATPLVDKALSKNKQQRKQKEDENKEQCRSSEGEDSFFVVPKTHKKNSALVVQRDGASAPPHLKTIIPR
jgi:hypothetical protein